MYRYRVMRLYIVLDFGSLYCDRNCPGFNLCVPTLVCTHMVVISTTLMITLITLITNLIMLLQ